MRTVIKAALAFGFVGAMAVSAPGPATAQGVYLSGPGVEVQVGDPDRRYRQRSYNRDYSYDGGPYAYAPGYRSRNGCPQGYTVQDGRCKPYRGY